MPSNAPQKNSDDILQGIIEGNYTELPSKADFQEILNQFVFDLDCDEEEILNPLNFNCLKPEGKNLAVHLYLKAALEQNKLNNAFDFFTQYIIANINTLTDETIKKLISLGTHYTTMYEAKLNNANSTFSEKDIVTTSSFINFLSSLFNIHNITEFETPGLIHQKGENLFPNITFGNAQTIDILVRNTIKLSEDLTHLLDFKQYSYKMENLLAFLDSLGNFGFKLKIKEDFQYFSHKIPEIVSKIVHSTNLKNFSEEDRERAGYTFLYGFDAGNAHDIESDCVDLLGLEKCPRPVTASVRLLQQIIQGHYSNQKPPFADFVQVESEIKDNIHTLDRDQYIHILDFLKNVLKTNNSPENKFNFKNLYTFAFNTIDNLNRDLRQRNQLDLGFAKAAESLSFYLFNIVKNNVNNQDLYDQIHIISQFSKLYESIIIHAPHLNSLLDTMSNHLFSILARNIDSESALQIGYSEFVNLIKDLNKVCRENPNACNIFKILAGSLKSLGSMSRKSSGYNLNATNEAKVLIAATQDNINPEQLSDAVSFFFKANISQTVLNQKCKEIFNVTGCRPASLIDLDNMAYGEINEITTLPPEEYLTEDSRNTTTPVSQIIVPAPAISQTTSASIVDHNAATELPAYSNSTIPFNQTGTETIENSHNDSALSDSEIKIGAAGIYGAGMGTYNAIMRHFFPNSVMLNIVGNAAFAASFPFMLFGMDQYIGSDTQDQIQLTWNDMAWQIPTNFGHSMVWNTGLYLVNVAANDISSLVSNNPRLQFATKYIATNTLPFVATVSSVIKKPIETSIQMGTSIASSSITSGFLNRFFPIKKSKPVDIEASAVEMELLNEKKDNIITDATEKDLTPEELFFKKVKFINLYNFNKMTVYLDEIIVDTQTFSTMQILQPSKELLQTRLGALKNLYDGLKSKDFIKSSENMTPEDAENQYKRNCESLKFLIESINKELQTNHFFSEDRNLKADLNKIEGLNSKDHTFEFKNKLGKIRDNIGFVDTIIKATLAHNENNADNINESKKKRRNTIHFHGNSSGSDSETRFSSASDDSGNSARSDGYGNTEFNNSNILEEQKLLHTRLNR